MVVHYGSHHLGRGPASHEGDDRIGRRELTIQQRHHRAAVESAGEKCTERNVRHHASPYRLREQTSAELMCVVKADAYNHGVERCVPVMEANGADAFGVATFAEARRVRELTSKPVLAWLWDVSEAIPEGVDVGVPGQLRVGGVHQLEAAVQDEAVHRAGALAPAHLITALEDADGEAALGQAAHHRPRLDRQLERELVEEAVGDELDALEQPAPADVDDLDLTVECITHRFTDNSKDVLLGWYPRTKLEMDEAARTRKFGKFGAAKYVYPKDTMAELRSWFAAELAETLPQARTLYWT